MNLKMDKQLLIGIGIGASLILLVGLLLNREIIGTLLVVFGLIGFFAGLGWIVVALIRRMRLTRPALVAGISFIALIIGAVLVPTPDSEDESQANAKSSSLISDEHNTENEEPVSPVSTLTPTSRPESTATSIPTLDLGRCMAAPEALVQQLSWGLTARGGSDIRNVYTVLNNDDRPWRFIAGRVTAPGIDEVMVWATASLDLDGTSLILATDHVAEEFSIWSLPSPGPFASKFDDEIKEVRDCAKAG